jgi:hypothetical protein
VHKTLVNFLFSPSRHFLVLPSVRLSVSADAQMVELLDGLLSPQTGGSSGSCRTGDDSLFSYYVRTLAPICAQSFRHYAKLCNSAVRLSKTGVKIEDTVSLSPVLSHCLFFMSDVRCHRIYDRSRLSSHWVVESQSQVIPYRKLDLFGDFRNWYRRVYRLSTS